MNHQFQHIAPGEVPGNVFQKIGKDWMLVSAEAVAGEPNLMTASWGGMGILWNKPVAFVFLRPSRYTTELVEATGRLSLSFFPGETDPLPGTIPEEKLRAAFRYCGSHSGRELDADGNRINKFTAAGVSLGYSDGVPFAADASTVLICRVLYRDTVDPEGLLDPELLKNYPDEDFHNVYVCEIRDVLKK